jgi:hypothetical protein
MTHRVNTPVSLQKPAIREHAIDRSWLDARGEKLPPRYKAPLEPRDRRNPSVARPADGENVPQAENRHEVRSIVIAIRGRSHTRRYVLRQLCVFPRRRTRIRVHGSPETIRPLLNGVFPLV